MRKFLIFLLVLAVLLVGADFGARSIATNKLGDALQSRLGVAQPPDVAIAGFPFLVQAVRGNYGTVSATLPATTLGPLADVDVAVVLEAVRLPLSDAVSGSVDGLTADAGRIRLGIPVASLAAVAGAPGLRITGGNGALVLSTTVTVLGHDFPVTARLNASITDAALVLTSGAVSGVGAALPAEVVSALAGLVDLTVPLDSLPFRVTGGSVSVAGTDVVVDATTGPLDLGGS